MKKIFYAFLFICLYNIQTTKSYNKINTKEDLFIKPSLVFSYQNDSINQLTYDSILGSFKEEDYNVALKKALKFRDKYTQEKNHVWAYKYSKIVGEIYEKTNEYSRALENYKNSLEILRLLNLDKNNSSIGDFDLADTFLKIGGSYFKLSRSIIISEDLDYLDSIKVRKRKNNYLDSAKIYFEEVEKIPNLNNKIDNIKAKVFTNLSGIYEQDSAFANAEYYVLKAIAIHKDNNNKLSEAKALNNLGNIYLSQENYEKSKEIYANALELIKNDDNPNTYNTKASLYSNLAWAMRKLEEFEAYDFQEKSYEIQGTLRLKEYNRIVEKVTQEYNFESKRDLFLEQEEVKRLKEQRVFWAIGIVALLVILCLAYIIRVKKLKEQNLELELAQTELLQNKKIDQLKSETQVRILNATIDGKESERKQIAETLHDSVSALLSSANLHLQATKKQFNGSTPLEVHKTQEIIQEASHKIRDLSHNLVSSVLLKFGLNYAVKDVAEKFSNSELQIDTDIKNIKRYHQNFEIKVYNIIHEFINNILKHSKAKNAFIKLHEIDNNLFIEISDDGLGFDKTKISQKDGLGINQIDARIQMMKGDFLIDSSLNNGTKISIKLPIVPKEKPSHV